MSAADPLTLAELHVLERVASGRTNAQTGRDLHLSESTIRTHVRRMFAKLGARDRAHLVALAFRAGYLWVTLDGEIRVGEPNNARRVVGYGHLAA